ncbi:hypothetical protein NXC24_PC00558 (plasmid) [Rhizobium sp. NXC24]|nr:hypothetical protein NXC24_PC00558 [Rhizobium sp. NXC24]
MLPALLLLLPPLVACALSRSTLPAAEINTLPLLGSSVVVVAWPSLPTPALICTPRPTTSPDWAMMVTELPLISGGTAIDVVDSDELSLKL